jgi:hypothetical protein
MSDPAPTSCRNCEAALTGPYCSQCGQRDIDYHQSIGTVFRDFLDSFRLRAGSNLVRRDSERAAPRLDQMGSWLAGSLAGGLSVSRSAAGLRSILGNDCPEVSRFIYRLCRRVNRRGHGDGNTRVLPYHFDVKSCRQPVDRDDLFLW